MILHRSTSDRWLSNSYLVAAGEGEDAVVIDAGAPAEPLLDAAKRDGLRVSLVVLTHHHGDHVSERAAFVPAPCGIHALEPALAPPCERMLADGERIEVGGLTLVLLHVPGHTRGQLNVLATTGDELRLFTGDTLFRASVGGTRGPGHGTFEELRRSIVNRLLALPGDTVIHPGHGPDTTVQDERDTNPFVRAWRGDDATLDEPCAVFGSPATLLTWASDYDGGHKAWVRWPDGTEDTVPGSRVVRS